MIVKYRKQEKLTVNYNLYRIDNFIMDLAFYWKLYSQEFLALLSAQTAHTHIVMGERFTFLDQSVTNEKICSTNH